MNDYLKIGRIPTITDDDLLDLDAKIRPLHVDDRGDLKMIVRPNTPTIAQSMRWLRETAFTWEKRLANVDGFHQIGTIITYHTFGAPSLFKPSIAEVIAQIRQQVPEPWFKRVRGYALDHGDLSAYHVLPDGYHFTKCHLYEQAILEKNATMFGGKFRRIIGYETHDGMVLTESPQR